jgi:hypothetical protein
VSQAEVYFESDLPGPVVALDLAAVVVPQSFRAAGLCADQVDRFVELGGAWPPILVARDDGLLIDGAHRLAAAQRLGMATIHVELFDGTPEDAFIEFIRRNVTHGLTLTLGERKRAAMQVLRAHVNWSDRRIAELCALSPKTVARLRLNVGPCPTDADPQSDDAGRWGRDNRRRPARQGFVRARVVDAIRAQPTASLRAIAAVAGVSPETVRLVRLNMTRAAESPQACQAAPAPAVPVTPLPTAQWRADSALASSSTAEEFLVWFEQTAVSAPDADRADSVPLSRVYVVADEARRRADAWLRFARALESRPGRSR